MTTHNLIIEHCNSIDRASISVQTGTLNIKYGPNGLGKSTIARAIRAQVANDGSLDALKPFKHRASNTPNKPSVSGADQIGSVLVFDEAYVSQFIFQQDEVIKNSFEVFIRTDAYLAEQAEIEALLSGVRSTLESSEDLEVLVRNLVELKEALVTTKSGSLSKQSKAYKALESGNKIENIPAQLSMYADFLKSEQPATWIAWQTKGNTFRPLSDKCPYCSSGLESPDKKELPQKIAEAYEPKAIEHLSNLVGTINKLGQYFEENCKNQLLSITKSKTELSPEEQNFLVSLHADLNTLITKLNAVRSMSPSALRDMTAIEEELGKLAINLELLPRINSQATSSVIRPINEKLSELTKRIGELKGKVNKHKAHIAKAVQQNISDVNGFLRSAGYKYNVKIDQEGNAYKMRLVHNDYDKHLDSPSSHLSYGERNAFALVLFMHQVLRERPDLVVLDDPVSSFDKTKKFAILHELFRGKATLRDTTVLLLTHDLEPAIDVIRGAKSRFQSPKPVAHFLSSRNGVVTEAQISESDIKTFAQICADNILTVQDEVIKCIYLRRHFEIINDFGAEYELLANLLHGRTVPFFKRQNGDTPMTAAEVSGASTEISIIYPGFNYAAILSIIQDKTELKRRFNEASVGYDKLQLFRIYKENHLSPNALEDSVVQKFVNETFHIENEYLMQLNPHQFDNVPEYIVTECHRQIANG